MVADNSNNINIFNSPFSIAFISSILVIVFEEMSNIDLGWLGNLCWLFLILSLVITLRKII
jgi:hypothetical protein